MISSLTFYSQILPSVSLSFLSSCSIPSIPIFWNYVSSKLLSPIYSSINVTSSTILKILNSPLHKKDLVLVNIEHHKSSTPWTQLHKGQKPPWWSDTSWPRHLAPAGSPKRQSFKQGPILPMAPVWYKMGCGPGQQPQPHRLISGNLRIFQQQITQRLGSLKSGSLLISQSGHFRKDGQVHQTCSYKVYHCCSLLVKSIFSSIKISRDVEGVKEGRYSAF